MLARAIFALMLFSFPLAYAIAITGTVSGYNTMLPGATVELLSDGVLYMNATTGSDSWGGYARYTFESVPPGIYIMRVSWGRGTYATHVRLINSSAILESGDEINIVLSKIFTDSAIPSSVYGKITSPVPPEGRIYFWKGGQAKWGDVMPDGQFVATSLSAGEYSINITRGEYAYFGTVSLESAEAKMLSITLTKAAGPAQESAPKLAGPPASKEGDVITVTAMRGTVPAAGAVVEVNAPSGKTALTADSAGKVYISAVEPGPYTFKFGNATLTVIAVPLSPSAPKPAAQNETQQPPPAPEQTPQGDSLPLALALAGVGVAIVAGIAIAAFVFLKLLKRMKLRKPAEYPPAQKKHPQPPEIPRAGKKEKPEQARKRK